jgi:hypothetical protein
VSTVERVRVLVRELGLPPIRLHDNDKNRIIRRLYGQFILGAPPGTRTPNPRIKSPLLCQLS